MHRRADNQAEKKMEHEMETVGSGVGDCNPEFETSGIGCASIHYCNSPTSIIGYDNRTITGIIITKPSPLGRRSLDYHGGLPAANSSWLLGQLLFLRSMRRFTSILILITITIIHITITTIITAAIITSAYCGGRLRAGACAEAVAIANL